MNMGGAESKRVCSKRMWSAGRRVAPQHHKRACVHREKHTAAATTTPRDAAKKLVWIYVRPVILRAYRCYWVDKSVV